MVSLNIDLGQIVLTVSIATVGYLIKRHIDQFDKKLEQFDDRMGKHEGTIFEINSNVQQLVGIIGLRQSNKRNG